MKIISSIFFATALLASCEENLEQQPSPFTNNTTVDMVAILNDPKNNLNVQANSFSEIDSSGILMFPLLMGETERGSGSLYYKEIPYSSYWNIIFFNSNTAQYHLLGEQKMLISNFDISYGKGNNANVALTKKNIFYAVISDDYNQDKKLTSDDPEYLFVSDREGYHFRQISPAGYHVNSWQFIKASNKIIMTATKDSDKNRKFNDKDEVAAFQIDIDKETQPSEIFSTDFKNRLKIMFDREWKRVDQ